MVATMEVGVFMPQRRWPVRVGQPRETLAERLERLRKTKKLTQEQVAARLKVVQNTVSGYEKGVSYPSEAMLAELERMFEQPDESLLMMAARERRDRDLPLVPGPAVAAPDEPGVYELLERLVELGLKPEQLQVVSTLVEFMQRSGKSAADIQRKVDDWIAAQGPNG